MRACVSCGKRSVAGRPYTRRRFQANLQRVKVLLNGSPKRVLVCTECIKHGRVQKAPSGQAGLRAAIPQRPR